LEATALWATCPAIIQWQNVVKKNLKSKRTELADAAWNSNQRAKAKEGRIKIIVAIWDRKVPRICNEVQWLVGL